MTVTVYGLPTCGMVKKARKWLEERGTEYAWVDLREAAPERARLAAWLDAFGWQPMPNTSGGSFRALGEGKKVWRDAEWLDAFAADAMLLKRPIIEIDGAPALVGFNEPAYAARIGA
ncbi:MAG: arsenate reductase family protein [Pseudomonadota bacterium]